MAGDEAAETVERRELLEIALERPLVLHQKPAAAARDAGPPHRREEKFEHVRRVLHVEESVAEDERATVGGAHLDDALLLVESLDVAGAHRRVARYVAITAI